MFQLLPTSMSSFLKLLPEFIVGVFLDLLFLNGDDTVCISRGHKQRIRIIFSSTVVLEMFRDTQIQECVG